MLSIERLYKCMLNTFVKMNVALRWGGGDEVSKTVEYFVMRS